MIEAHSYLYLYPKTPTYRVNHSTLIHTLTEHAFLGEALSSTRYAVGEQFLSYVTFLGCSPDIELSPQPDKAFCYIDIGSNTHKDIHFISGANVKTPRCPQCRSDQQQLAQQLTKNGYQSLVQCPSCQFNFPPEQPNWRKSAVIATQWLRIGHIYEAEAVPTPTLLDALAMQSTTPKEEHSPWQYSYIRFEHTKQTDS